MTSYRSTRIRIDDEGCLEVVNPGFDSLDLLRSIDPGFRIRQAELAGFASPRFLQTRQTGCDLAAHKLAEEPEEVLWEVHDVALERLRTRGKLPLQREVEASLLDLKMKLCHRVLSKCRLCARVCGVDRACGELGICGLGVEGVVVDRFIHIAEEPPINPSLLLSLSGCGLRCRYCQQAALLDPASVDGERLDAAMWDKLRIGGARSLSFIGGNPDESLYAVLRFLATAPSDWELPVVWNCHAYSTPETMQLLDGLVDAYVPDFKYGDEYCSGQLSEASDYPRAAKVAVKAMLAQNVPVIVRILVLLGHLDCCHVPVLDFLASLNAGHLLVSVRDQYCPDWKIAVQDGDMARRSTGEEVEEVREWARSLKLRLVD